MQTVLQTYLDQCYNFHNVKNQNLNLLVFMNVTYKRNTRRRKKPRLKNRQNTAAVARKPSQYGF